MIWKDLEGNVYKISYSEELLRKEVRLLKLTVVLLLVVAVVVPASVFACFGIH
jgi:hypothetical protein